MSVLSQAQVTLLKKALNASFELKDMQALLQEHFSLDLEAVSAPGARGNVFDQVIGYFQRRNDAESLLAAARAARPKVAAFEQLLAELERGGEPEPPAPTAPTAPEQAPPAPGESYQLQAGDIGDNAIINVGKNNTIVQKKGPSPP